MAEWWIKVFSGLTTAREVEVMALTLGKTPQHVAGRLLEVWDYWATESEDGELQIAPSEEVSIEWFDQRFQEPGLARAMLSVGWMSVSSHGAALVCRPKGIRFRKSIRASDRARKAASDPVPSETDRKVSGCTSTSTSKVLSLKSSSGSKKEERPPMPEVFTGSQVPGLWREWEELRRRKRWGWYAPKTEERWLSKLADLGPTRAEEIIRRSLDNEYRGLFPEARSSAPAPSAKDALRGWADEE